MEIPWDSDRCGLCVLEGDLTLEHVIPEALGGILVGRFLCRCCNSTLGAQIEASARFDPSIRLAAEGLLDQIPSLANRILQGQEYVAEAEAGQVRARRLEGRFAIQGSAQPDGSVVVPSEEAEGALRRMLSREGACEGEIVVALARFSETRVDEPVDLGRGVQAIPRRADDFQPRLATDLMDDRLALAVAYEFLALLTGEQIFDECLDPIRAALRSTEGQSDAFRVVRGRSNRGGVEPLHIISIRQALPSVIVDVRLFRWIWYEVHLPVVAFGYNRLAYVHNLATDEERVVDLDEAAP